MRSASVGRDKRADLQARYWAFLFENVKRAVDDLYTTCESDESIPATKEVILNAGSIKYRGFNLNLLIFFSVFCQNDSHIFKLYF